MNETSGSNDISTKLARIATLAKSSPGMPLTTLAHHIDVNWLREAHRRTRKDGALGIDGQSAKQYAEHLEENLQGLHERAKSGMYRAPPVRRTYIPKASGEPRPLGIPTFEDKVLQRAVAMVLEWCRAHRHVPLPVQQRALNAKLRGHYGYFGRRGNSTRLWRFLQCAVRAWWRGMRRRSQRGLSWAKMYRLLKRYPLATPLLPRRA